VPFSRTAWNVVSELPAPRERRSGSEASGARCVNRGTLPPHARLSSRLTTLVVKCRARRARRRAVRLAASLRHRAEKTCPPWQTLARSIVASRVQKNLTPIGGILPLTETQARPLTLLPEPDQRVPCRTPALTRTAVLCRATVDERASVRGCRDDHGGGLRVALVPVSE